MLAKLLREILTRLERIEKRLTIQGEITMSALDDLTAQVAQNTSVEESAVTLIKGIAAELASAGTDQTALAALQAKLNTSASDLAAAIAANTPAAPATPAAS